MNRSIMVMLDDVAKRCGISLRRTARIVGVCRSNYSRWKGRVADQVALVQSPGPRKMVPADIAAITLDIAGLSHGKRRTLGTTALQNRYRECMSRRDLQELVRNERARQVVERREGYDEVTWQGAGIVWAMDDTLCCGYAALDGNLWIHHVRDIGAKYSLQPISGREIARGEQVAANLSDLCSRHGAPLFLKRDNGGNLNGSDVDEVLADRCIIPFNSPVFTPTYNGSIERSQGTLKAELVRQLTPAGKVRAEYAQPYVRAAAYEINHRPLASNGGSHSCHYRSTHLRNFTRNERKVIYDWITDARISILENEGRTVNVHTAQRWAVTAWLLKNGLMSINRH
jgi:transposase InsO family protein